MRQGEGALDLLTRVLVATRRAELVAIAPGTLGDLVGTIRQTLSKVYGLSGAHLLSFNTWNP